MSIDRIDGSGVPGQAGRIGGPRPERTGSRPAPAERGDQVELSAEVRERAALLGASRRLPELRREKIDALRFALDGGNLRADPRSVAHALLEFEDALER